MVEREFSGSKNVGEVRRQPATCESGGKTHWKPIGVFNEFLFSPLNLGKISNWSRFFNGLKPPTRNKLFCFRECGSTHIESTRYFGRFPFIHDQQDGHNYGTWPHLET